MASLVPVAHTLVQNRQDVGLPGALYHHQILNKEAILDVPAGLEHA